MDTLAFNKFSYGVFVVATMDGDRPTGCITNTAMQITFAPHGFAISVNHSNYTNQCIKKSGKFAVSVLPENVDPALIERFGFHSGKTMNKFDGVKHEMIEGEPVVDGACAYIVCEVQQTMETETHTIFFGGVLDCGVLSNDKEMTYAYYHANVKKNVIPKPDKVADSNEEKEVWVCSVCGYVYALDTPFEEQPDSFTCPVCHQPKSVFVKKKQ